MDELNKQQIVLLTLLVSIVTSIATGITTISLVGQNPVQTVTQTVNRVVEKTIERVVESNEDKEEDVVQEKTLEKEIITVVVKEEDLTVDAIENNSKSIVRIFDTKTGNFVSIGVIIDSSGTIYIPNMSYNKRSNYIGEFEAGSFALNYITNNDADKYTIMKPNVEDVDLKFSPVVIGDIKSIKLGQSVISLSGINNNTVSTGIITSLEETDGVANEEGFVNKIIASINTSVRSENVLRGSILLNLNGKLIGIKTGRELNTTTFYPGNVINKYVVAGNTEEI